MHAKGSGSRVGCASGQGAEEFRAAKRGRDGWAVGAAAPELSTKRARGVAFGSGAADEDDAFGIAEDYAEGAAAPGAYTFELASDEEDDAPPAGRALGRS